MSFFLDVITVAVFILVIYRAYRKGLIKTLIEMAGFIVSCLAAVCLSNPIGDWIDKKYFNELVTGLVTKFVKTSGENNLKFFTGLLGSFPGAVNKSLSGINAMIGKASEKAMTQVISRISAPVSASISRSISFFAILSVCFIAIRLLARFSDVVKRMPIIRTLNGLGGAAIGIIEAVLVMFVFSTLLNIVISFMALQKNPPLTSSTINSTYIYKYIYNVNPLTTLLLKK